MPNFDYGMRDSQRNSPSYRAMAQANQAVDGSLFLDEVKAAQLGEVMKNVLASLNYDPDERAMFVSSVKNDPDITALPLDINNIPSGTFTQRPAGSNYNYTLLAPVVV
jgi:hypothetical protein